MNTEEYMRQTKLIEATRNDDSYRRTLHGAMGLCTEAGEIMEQVKHFEISRREYDFVNLKEELGDILFYIAIICDAQGWTIEKVMEANIRKLKVRYKGAFTVKECENRDLAAEREALKETEL